MLSMLFGWVSGGLVICSKLWSISMLSGGVSGIVYVVSSCGYFYVVTERVIGR